VGLKLILDYFITITKFGEGQKYNKSLGIDCREIYEKIFGKNLSKRNLAKIGQDNRMVKNMIKQLTLDIN